MKLLAGEVVAHLRSVAGADALLAAYNEARRGVAEARVERRRQRTLQARACAACCGPGSTRGRVSEALWLNMCVLVALLHLCSLGATCCNIDIAINQVPAACFAHKAPLGYG